MYQLSKNKIVENIVGYLLLLLLLVVVLLLLLFRERIENLSSGAHRVNSSRCQSENGIEMYTDKGTTHVQSFCFCS